MKTEHDDVVVFDELVDAVVAAGGSEQGGDGKREA